MKKWMLLRLAGALLLSVFSTQTLAVLNGPATSAGSHTISWEFNNSRSDVYIVEWLPDGSGAPVATSTWGWPGSIQLTGRAPGTYTYTADWCDTSFNCTTDTLVVTVTGQPTSPPPAEVTSNLETGTLPMTMDVAANGDAVASVPLQLITGVDGFQPSLGLVYSSGRAIQRAEQRLPEDTIGYGWRLEGLSQIRRCVVDKSSSSSIGLNNNDSLCLDGMPLVRTGGSHLNVGATYRTQIES
ncbi:MAG: hypothetical protein OIF34_07895, partial [Porticoccaceae bacterium]|nr:hypothetical protein [Porticoccaceae bacterium]